MSFKKDTSINELTESKRLVSSEIVKLEKNIISVPVYGKLFSLKEINIVTEANGIFYGEKFKTGMKFSKGDTLGYIKYDEIESNLNSQKSNLLNQASKIVSEIKFDYPDSYQSWFNFMDKINFNDPLPKLPEIKDKKLKNYLSGKNFFNSYFTAKSTEDRLNKHLIISEFNGSLSDVSIKSGTAVVFGQKIGKFHNPNMLEFESNTSIKNTLLIKKNMQVNIKSDEYSGERNGFVSRINKTLNPSSQNMSVFIETNDDDLYNGMYVYGNIIVGEVDNTFKIKRNLIQENNVFTIVDNKLISTEIDVIQVFEDNAIIRGLNNNDRVLNEPIKGSYSGMEIRFNK
ncbi:MAG: efflux RND transporter periplasmic adaptor subunit [Flavobacteriales bacterium]